MTLPAVLSADEKLLIDKYALLKRKRKELQQKQLALAEAQKEAATTHKPSTPKRVPQHHKGQPVAPKRTAADNVKADDLANKKEFKKANSLVHRAPNSERMMEEQSSPLHSHDMRNYNSVPPYQQHEDRERWTGQQDRRRGNTVFVAGYGVDENVLKKAFEKYGPILRLHMEAIKGHGFVTLQSADAAQKAIAEMHGEMVSGVTLRVSLARRQNYSDSKGHNSSFSERRGRRPSYSANAPSDRIPPAAPAAMATPADSSSKPNRNLVSYSDEFDF